MIKKLLILGFVSLANLTILTAAPTFDIQESSDSAFQQRMDQAIQKAEDEVQDQLKNATRRDTVPMYSDKIQLQNAIIQLEIKKTLVNNFKGTESLKSGLVRAKLLEILNKSIITESDLAGLQNLVNQVKATLHSNKSSTSATGITGTTGTTGTTKF